MPGWIERDQRKVGLQVAGVVDLGGAARRAGAAGQQQAEEIAGVVGQLGDKLTGEAQKEAQRGGEAAGQTEALIRDANGQLQPPTLDQHMLLTEGEKARRATLASRYGSQFVLENQKAITDLRTAAAGDPDRFIQAAEAHRDGVISAMPEPLRGPVSEGIQREIGRHYGSMQAERVDRDRKNTLVAGKEVLQGLQGDLDGAVRAGNTTQVEAIGGAMRAKLGELVGLGLLLPAEADVMTRQMLVVDPLVSQIVRSASQADPATGRRIVEELLTGERSAGGAATPDASLGSRVPAAWVPHIQRSAAANNIPEDVARALFGLESGGNANAVSPKGATGPAQAMPTTGKDPGFGVPPLSAADAKDPAKAIPWGMAYLGAMQARYGNLRDALMAYNWGPGNVDDWIKGGRKGKVPNETQAYVDRLAGGGGHVGDGWQTAWDKLRPDERVKAAREASTIISFRQESLQRSRIEADHQTDAEISSVNARIGTLQQRALDAAAGVEGVQPLSPDERASLNGLYARRLQLLESRRSMGTEGAAQAPGALADAESRAAARTSSAALSLEQAEKLFGQDPDFLKLREQIKGLRVEDRTAVLDRFVEQRGSEWRGRQRAVQADQALGASLTGVGPSVSNEEQYRAAAGRELQRRLTPTSTPQDLVREAVAVARAGAPPPQMMAMIERGLTGATPETTQEAGRLVRALMEDPRAFNTLAGIEPAKRKALVRAADALDAGGNPETTMQQFRADMKQQVGPLDQARLRLGATEKEQNEKLDGWVGRMLDYYQYQQTPGIVERFGKAAAFIAMPGGGTADALVGATRDKDPAALVPQKLRDVLRDRMLAALPHYADLSTWTMNPFGVSPLEAALRKEAGDVLTHEWGQSGIASMPGAPANRFQWVQGSPETRYAVPDEKGRPSVEWVQPFVHGELNRIGLGTINGTPAKNFRFGVNLSLVPIGRDPDGNWQYQVLRKEHGTWFAINQPAPGGKEGLAPLTLRLAERASELRAERAKADLDTEAATFDETAPDAAARRADMEKRRQALPPALRGTR